MSPKKISLDEKTNKCKKCDEKYLYSSIKWCKPCNINYLKESVNLLKIVKIQFINYRDDIPG